MTRDITPYPAYKDSHLPWLGLIPQHWDVERTKARIANIVESASERRLGEPHIALEHVESWTGIIRDSMPDTEFDSQVKRFHTGDVLFGKLRPYLAKVALPRTGGICVGEFFVLRPRHPEVVLASYLSLLLRAQPIIDIINSSTFGAKMPRADWQFVGSLQLAFPPLDEQAAIVRYLEHASQHVRRYLRTQLQLISLLREEKQMIIQSAVTRGIDPNAPLTASGVAWLGDLPSHWDIVRLGAVLRERGESNDDLKVTEVLSVLRERGVIPYAEKGNIGNKKSDDITRYKIVRPNDIVVNSMNVIIGSVGLSQYEGCLSPVYYVLTRRNEYDDPQYLNAYFQTKLFQRSLVRIGYGILPHRMRIPMSLLKCEPFPRPPASEQRAIVQYIGEATSRVDATIEHAQRQAILIKEYHSRLIADVVTGKLDVREVAANLPEESSREEVFLEGEELFAEDGLEEDDSGFEASLEEVEA